jgi:hypothetical protein
MEPTYALTPEYRKVLARLGMAVSYLMTGVAPSLAEEQAFTKTMEGGV